MPHIEAGHAAAPPAALNLIPVEGPSPPTRAIGTKTVQPIAPASLGLPAELPPPPSPPPSLRQQGCDEQDIAALLRAVAAPEGLVLVLGPPGAGKTTLLRALLESPALRGRPLRELRPAPSRRRLLPAAHGAHASQVLLADPATAAAVAGPLLRAAQSGRLALAAIELDRAHQVFARFRAFGVEPAEVASYLNVAVARRLLPLLCRRCARPDERDEPRHVLASASNSWLAGQALRPGRAAPTGCGACSHSGYAGRIAIDEVLEVDARVRSLVEAGAGPLQLEQQLYASGRSLWDRGLRLLANGLTSLEALRAAVREPR